MSKTCRRCFGKGRWLERIEHADHVEMIWHMCNDCKGTGVSQDPEDGDDYDIGGSSYEDDE